MIMEVRMDLLSPTAIFYWNKLIQKEKRNKAS